jgi:glycosyltransferase involved in cell wall biosynthesis
LLIPILGLKLLGKKVVLMPGGIASKAYYIRKDPLFKFVYLLTITNFFLADKIVIYSHTLAQELNINQSNLNKIIIAHRHFVDFTKFMIKKRINERANVIGYIGRFAEEKGILNLVKSIPLVLNRRKDIYFVLCGEGELFDEIKKIVQRESLGKNVKLTGLISHIDVPNFLNNFKLLVLPSYTEGLPNIVLEAMACGTPVLVTPVGAIPDIIKDGKTGFLLKSNDPKNIAEKIVELLDKYELLEEVSMNAYNYVKENFNYEKTLESWRRILKQMER